jgi:hypothetical protein
LCLGLGMGHNPVPGPLVYGVADARAVPAASSSCEPVPSERERSALGYSGAVERLDAAGLDLLGAGQQLGGREVESCGQTSEAADARVALAGLDVGDPALVQFGVVVELLLGEPEFFAAGLDGEAEGGLESRGGRHGASFSAQAPRHNDIAVDLCLTFG